MSKSEECEMKDWEDISWEKKSCGAKAEWKLDERDNVRVVWRTGRNDKKMEDIHESFGDAYPRGKKERWTIFLSHKELLTS